LLNKLYEVFFCVRAAESCSCMWLMPRLHMQVWQQIPNGKLVIKYFLVVKLTQYLVCKEDRKLTLYCKQEI